MKRTIIKPAHLRKGDMVGLVCPASSPFEQGDIEFTYEWLQKLGLRYKTGTHIFDSYSDMAGRDEDRLRDLHEMWADRDVQAILPLRGGNGSARLLPGLDFELIKKNPKIIIGYSDLTALINAIHQQTGLITFHGPMGGSFFRSSYSYHFFNRALMSNRPLGLIVDPLPSDLWNPRYPPPRMVIAEGRARGPLVGGCLTLIKELMGTPWELETEGKILFLEDLREEPHTIDRILTQLLLAGKLQKAKAIILAEFVACKPGDSKRESFDLNHSVETIFRERLSRLGIPVVYGLRCGHGHDQLTLPIGVTASLEAHRGKVKFKIEESATL